MKEWKLTHIEEDISHQKPFISGKIDRVGIEHLEMPIRVQSGHRINTFPAEITAMVSLDKNYCRGIHMSRIYLTLHNFLEKEVLTLKSLKKLLRLLVQSQKGISKQSYLKFNWKCLVKRKALKSLMLEGWRSYPVFYEGNLLKNGNTELKMGMNITYSSTCPCSASLARTLIQKKFKEDFLHSKSNKLLDKNKIFHWLGKESSIAATPHAQKSLATVTLQVKKEKQSFVELIDEMEKILGTPVQTAVKRVDEQEFAKLNSENLMFSEDAARRITHLLSKKSWITHHQIYVKHFESLHPFEVACLIKK